MNIPTNVYCDLVKRLIDFSEQIDILDYIEDYHREKLNNLLNDLNGVDYKLLQAANLKPTHELIKSLTIIPVAEDTLIVKSCCLMVAIINRQTQTLSMDLLARTLDWLQKFIRNSQNIGICDALHACQVLIKANSLKIADLSEYSLINLLDLLLILLQNPNCMLKKKTLKYESCSPCEIQLSVVQCLEQLLTIRMEISDSIWTKLLKKCLEIIYQTTIEQFQSETNFYLLISSAINICRLCCLHDRSICSENLGELLGAARAFLLYGISDTATTRPTKVFVSQQAVTEPQMAESAGNKGGKIAKLRKTKSKKRSSKTKNYHQNVSLNKSGDDIEIDFQKPYNRFEQNDLNIWESEGGSGGNLIFPVTSDSDFSESEIGKSRKDVHKQANLRFAALSLVGVIGKIVDKKTLFGYWHCLFPAEPLTTSSLALFNSVLHDSNPRCRVAALQSISAIVSGTKSFLTRAENSDRPPTSYMPFSLALGDMIVSMYGSLTKSISTESSVPVLVQVLKCLIVLIQATTFSRLKPGIISQFVFYIRRLVYHKDTAIQVAAFMVMETLISCNEKTDEITKCLGIQIETVNVTKPVLNRGSKQYGEQKLLEDELLDDDDFEYNLDDDDNVGDTNSEAAILEKNVPNLQILDKNDEPTQKIPWLLHVSLENLGVTLNSLKMPARPKPMSTIRIECLSCIGAMSRNFSFIKPHLTYVSRALDASFKDDNPDIRLHTVKCCDILFHSIGLYLIESKLSTDSMEFNEYFNFWLTMKPFIVTELQGKKSLTAIKTYCCDALSNIGVTIFEKLTHLDQILLISILHGASNDDEPSVRASAIRALAIYVMFPSLRENYCYIENTAAGIIRWLYDGNVDMLIKGSWALGNITDAMLLNHIEANDESSANNTKTANSNNKISNDLLKRLFEISLTCKQNDKVRSNAVRALGNLLRLISEKHVRLLTWQELCKEAIEQLNNYCTNVGNVKVKWNACYAIGKFMHNSAMFEVTFLKFFDWREIIIPAICQLMVRCDNFKVRINAAAALTALERRDNLTSCNDGTDSGGDGYSTDKHFIIIWQSLLEALEESDHITDFNEYQHRDNLQDQLCVTISYYISLADRTDFVIMEQKLQNFDTISTKWSRVINRMIPERAADLLKAIVKLKTISDMCDIKNNERKAVHGLIKHFYDVNDINK